MKTTYFFLKLLIITLLCSCSSDDESPEPIKKEFFRVKAVGLFAYQMPPTEGGALEVYGTMSTKKVLSGETVEERILWERNRTNWVSVGSNVTVINSEGSEQVFTLTEDEIRNGAEIEVYANMMDKDPDGNPDDFLGEETEVNAAGIITIRADEDESTDVQLILDEFNGITLLVRFTIEHIRD